MQRYGISQLPVVRHEPLDDAHRHRRLDPRAQPARPGLPQSGRAERRRRRRDAAAARDRRRRRLGRRGLRRADRLGRRGARRPGGEARRDPHPLGSARVSRGPPDAGRGVAAPSGGGASAPSTRAVTTTAPTINAAPASVAGPGRSSRSSAPRPTATSGFTYWWVTTCEIGALLEQPDVGAEAEHRAGEREVEPGGDRPGLERLTVEVARLAERQPADDQHEPAAEHLVDGRDERVGRQA